jgi:signal recognition particle subunit SRP19
MNHKDFMIIYPSYLDSCKSLKQGRRIGKELAVDTPTVSDISQALQSLGLKHVLQPHKGYSRDPYTLWDNPGRVKVEPSPKITILEDDENDLPPGNGKRRLLLEIASRIPSLPSRIQRLEAQAASKKAAEEEKADKQKQLKQQQQLAQTQQQHALSSKKKGKKKR